MIAEVRVAMEAMRDAGYPELSDALSRIVEELEGIRHEASETQAHVISLLERRQTEQSVLLKADVMAQVPLRLLEWACDWIAHGRRLEDQDIANYGALRNITRGNARVTTHQQDEG